MTATANPTANPTATATTTATTTPTTTPTTTSTATFPLAIGSQHIPSPRASGERARERGGCECKIDRA